MKTVILAGGLGSRMREETEFKPKPMVEIGTKPIIWHIMKNYNFYGFDDFIVCMGYKKESIIDYFINFNSFNNDIEINLGPNTEVNFLNHDDNLKDIKVTLSDTGLNTNTGERLRRVKKYIPEGETFMMTYGDGLSNVNLKKLLKFHKKNKKLVTLTAVRPPARFGALKLQGNNVSYFKEKSKLCLLYTSPSPRD